MSEETEIKEILRRHDDVQISPVRVEKLYARIFAALDEPVKAPSLPLSRPFVPPASFPSFRFISAGALALVLGLFVGQNYTFSPTVQITEVQAVQQTSVVAMLEPWENFIVKE